MQIKQTKFVIILNFVPILISTLIFHGQCFEFFASGKISGIHKKMTFTKKDHLFFSHFLQLTKKAKNI